MLFNSDEVSDRWLDYIRELYSDRDREKTPQRIQCITGPKILKAEVEEAIRKLRLGKASETDKICAEILKHMGNTGLEELTHLCNTMYDTGNIPIYNTI